jgi:hypothetical protein
VFPCSPSSSTASAPRSGSTGARWKSIGTPRGLRYQALHVRECLQTLSRLEHPHQGFEIREELPLVGSTWETPNELTRGPSRQKLEQPVQIRAEVSSSGAGIHWMRNSWDLRLVNRRSSWLSVALDHGTDSALLDLAGDLSPCMLREVSQIVPAGQDPRGASTCCLGRRPSSEMIVGPWG